jgi:hypothetical protein
LTREAKQNASTFYTYMGTDTLMILSFKNWREDKRDEINKKYAYV